MAARRSPGSSSALSSISDEEMAGPSSPSHSTISDNEGSIVDAAMPPAKKRKHNPRGSRAHATLPQDSPTMKLNSDSPAPDLTDISSDTSGSVPPSPRPHPAGQPATVDENALSTEQVRVCAWDGCDVGDLGNQDNLIAHINDIHIGQKGPKAKYPCEWVDCKTKGKQHGSAYSLRNHMKSHTKERAHYCSLPECDRSFTRSDALHKHMRTVHETESFRTAEHYPKLKPSQAANQAAPPSPVSVQASPAPPKSSGGPDTAADENGSKPSAATKITLKLGGKEETKEPLSPQSRAEICPFAVDDDFSLEELEMPRDSLLRLLRRQIKWAEEDSAVLTRQVDEAEARRHEEWLAKEMVLENLLEAEVMRGLDKGTMKNDVWIEGKRVHLDDADLDIAAKLPFQGDAEPWYRNASHLRKQVPLDDAEDVNPANASNGIDGDKHRSAADERPSSSAKVANDDEDRDVDMDRD